MTPEENPLKLLSCLYVSFVSSTRACTNKFSKIALKTLYECSKCFHSFYLPLNTQHERTLDVQTMSWTFLMYVQLMSCYVNYLNSNSFILFDSRRNIKDASKGSSPIFVFDIKKISANEISLCLLMLSGRIAR